MCVCVAASSLCFSLASLLGPFLHLSLLLLRSLRVHFTPALLLLFLSSSAVTPSSFASSLIILSSSVSQFYPHSISLPSFFPTSLRFIPRRRCLCTSGKTSFLHPSSILPGLGRLNATGCFLRHCAPKTSSSLPSSSFSPSLLLLRAFLRCLPSLPLLPFPSLGKSAAGWREGGGGGGGRRDEGRARLYGFALAG